MASPAANLTAALRQRRVLIADENSRRDSEKHIAKLQAVSEKIVALAAQLPAPVDPQLAHFLARCSYDKALDFLESA